MRRLTVPPHDRQVDRLRPQFQTLRRTFETERVELRPGIEGAEPEKVLVLELAGTVDNFLAAVKRIPGLEWLAAIDTEDMPSDSDFHREDDESLEKPIGGQLYLVMSNVQASLELLSLWERWAEDSTFDPGWGRRSLRRVFEQLRAIRTWNVQDRLRSTGLLDEWRTVLGMGNAPVPFEVELWFRGHPASRTAAADRVRQLIDREGGETLSATEIPEVRYHALVGALPRDRIEAVVESEDSQLVVCDDVMFLRPIGQVDTPTIQESEPSEAAAPALPATLGSPIVGVLDGLPLENHEALAGWLTVDDPDDWGADYLAAERLHGTWMASLIIHGDLQASEDPAARRVYVRPVLQPDPYFRRESAPRAQTFPDVVRRAIQRALVGRPDEPATAPTVEIVNFSIGDPSRPFSGQMSALARTIDWLSYELGILFVISAGNQPGPLELIPARKDYAGLSDEALQEEILRAALADAHVRRLLSPAEAINALTIGRSHADESGNGPFAGVARDSLLSRRLTTHTSAFGPGFRRSVKPDATLDGGRQMVELQPGPEDDPAIVTPRTVPTPPGQSVATPGAGTALLTQTIHVGGTSNAAALTTRRVADTRDRLASRFEELSRPLPPRPVWVSLLKALAVHGCSWGEEAETLATIYGLDARESRNAISRSLGYGWADHESSLLCSDQRVTLLGWGELADGEAHEYLLPAPSALSGQAVSRRLIVTLAWLSPVYAGSRLYRGTQMWVTPPTDTLGIARRGPDWQAVQRGTVQHEVLTGTRATAFEAETMLPIKVNSRADGGTAEDVSPYGLVVTLEVDPEVELPIYEQIEVAIRPEVRIRPGNP